MSKFWLLILPTLAWFYIGLFVTMLLWYPSGLSGPEFRSHLINFSVVYALWLLVFFIYTLFDLPTFRSSLALVSRLVSAFLTSGLIAVVYFYFQPELILTPRRFLLVHVFISMVGVAAWYALIQYILPRIWQRKVYLHPELFANDDQQELEDYLKNYNMLGWQYVGRLSDTNFSFSDKVTVVLPVRLDLESQQLQKLFDLKRVGVEFLAHDKFIEQIYRRVDLTGLNEVWFLHSVDYRMQLFDWLKRVMDILVGLIGTAVFLVLLPFLTLLIKLDSAGTVFFVQERTGQFGKTFRLYKLRTMSGEQTNTWTEVQDQRITKVGKWLRRLRLDELPQFINILKGDMSLVGPRPEQVHLVIELTNVIPYYNERHMVKPGLTGWSQLHLYANSIEGTKLKLQYDFYYIKHRSFWFDLEIILRTIFHIISLRGM